MGIVMGFLDNIQRFLIYFAATCLVCDETMAANAQTIPCLVCFGLICRICYNKTPERRRKGKSNQIFVITSSFSTLILLGITKAEYLLMKRNYECFEFRCDQCRPRPTVVATRRSQRQIKTTTTSEVI